MTVNNKIKFKNDFLACFISFWKNYFGWGRATRSEYWYIILFNMLINLALKDAHILLILYMSITIIPGFCLCVRRLHDINKSAWNILWILLPIIGSILLIIFLTREGDSKENRFGSTRI